MTRRTSSHAIPPVLRLALLALGLLAGVASAAQTAEQTVERTVNAVLEVLDDPTLQSTEARKQRIRRIADGVFDWREMTRRSLGPHWGRLTPDQRNRFVALFEERLADRYLSDMLRASGDEKVRIQGAEDLGRSSKVSTLLITSSGERVPIDYFLHQEDEHWWIHDISVANVSLVSHYRQTFDRHLTRTDADTLLDRMSHQSAGRESEPEEQGPSEPAESGEQ